jgi:hypothetical protein
MKGRLPIVLSVVALLIAAAGYTSIGEAAREALPRASFAANADKVDGIHASKRRRVGRLYPLGRNGQFPASVIPPGIVGIEILNVVSASDSSTTKTATASCPTGKRVIGGGARAIGAAGADIAISQSYPPTITQWAAVATEINAVGGPWTLHVQAVCANVT